VSSGTLPSGLTLASNGTISGTPTASAQSSSFTVKVTDSSSPAQSASSLLSISITSGSSVLSITTTSLPTGIAGSSYSSALSASGGAPPYSWVESSGTLPSGLTLASNGTISGIPTASAQSTFTVKVNDSSSPGKSASAQLAISIASGVTATPGATATQYVMSFSAANTSQCMIEVSTSPSYSTLVHAVDPTIFANANLDGQTNVGSRAFVVGQKWIAQENVAPPFIIVGAASRAGNSKLVTVNYPTQPFVVGDNIVITGMTNSAYNDPWTRVDVASANSFSYEVLTAASAPGDVSGGGTISRANRYSLALAADTTYYYRIGGATNTCGANPATGSFTTMNIPNGNTWEEGPVRDNNGLQIEPTIPESRTASLVDPLTGAQVYRISLFSDGNTFARGWSSAFYRPCNITPSSNGFYHCIVGIGDSGTGGLYSIKSTGETHWLGFMKNVYTDSNGHTCCQQSTNPYLTAEMSPGSTTNANAFYAMSATNAGYTPSKNVIVSSTYTGNDAVDASPTANWSVTTVALTPDPSNTLDDKLAAYDATFDPAHFHGCGIQEVAGDYIAGQCGSFNQGSPTWAFAFQISTASVIAMGANFKNPRCRWCGSHGAGSLGGSTKWMSDSAAYMTDNTTGVWDVQLASPITSGSASLSVTAPHWQANTAYNPTAVAGFAIVDSNGNFQVAMPPASGVSGSSPPVWNVTPGGITTDGTVTWTNEGVASSPKEPYNIYPFPNAAGTARWGFLMPVAGATGGGGEYNGDLFHFEDGTNECVRVIAVGASGTWSLVTRAVHGNSLTPCSSTASAHAAGASLRALCENSSEARGLSLFYWDFIDDPHMTDATNNYFVQLNQGAGHGYTRQPPIYGNLWNTFAVTNAHNPFIAADFTGLPTFSILTQLTFNNLLTTASGVAHQDYTTWDFEAASFKDSAVGSLYFVTGAGPSGYGTFSKVAGTNTIYKYALGTVPLSYTLPFVPSSGGNTIKDISGPSSLLTDNGATPLSCVTVVAGECWTGSSPGEMYANLPVVDAGSGNICNGGGENNSYLGHDWCMMNTSTFGDALNQYGLLSANFISNYPNGGWPQYGAGLSRRLVQNLLGGMRLQSLHPHTVPDGSGALFESCAADPHITTNGGAAVVETYGCQAFLASIPPQPTSDGLDRTLYEIVSITIGPGSGGATHARVKYGFEENEPIRGTTWPPTIHYYCTQYQGRCYHSDQNLTLNSQQILAIGVPQRVLFYEVEYLNASNQVVASDPVTMVAIP
jgi:hypothetical protein